MTDTTAEAMNTYFIAEFARYFPNYAAIIVHLLDENETISVHVHSTYGAETMWLCKIGSDDDYYIFRARDYDNYITVPLMPE
jgi:hypothetical protein